MKKTYDFVYGCQEASASFIVDTDVFTPELANATLEFFSWDYDKDNDPIDEVMKKYALEAIKIATLNNYNEGGVISEFEDLEGFAKINGEYGIELTEVTGYEFDADSFDIQIKIIEK